MEGPLTPDGDHAMDGVHTTTTAPLDITLASGEKAKARDLIADIRTLKRIEQEHRRPTPDERQALARFGGFGALALCIFPDPGFITSEGEDFLVSSTSWFWMIDFQKPPSPERRQLLESKGFEHSGGLLWMLPRDAMSTDQVNALALTLKREHGV
jgi:hypothetical protein